MQSILKQGATKPLAQAIESELSELLEAHQHLKVDGTRPSVVRHGYLPQRTIQTGLGDISIQIPKVRDRSHSGIKFNSKFIPPYLKRTKNIEAFLPWLYLRGISTGDFKESLKHLLGQSASALSASTISRLKPHWIEEYHHWCRRDLSNKQYAYIWADGIYSTIRQDDRLCLLVMIGVGKKGNKEILAIEDGYRESSDS